MRPSPQFHAVFVLLLCLGSAYLCAAAWGLVVLSEMKREALEIGPSVYRTLIGAWIWGPVFRVATVAGLVIFLVAVDCLRERRLLRCGALVAGGTVLFVVGMALVSPLLSLAGSPVVAVTLLAYCRSTRVGFLQRVDGDGFGAGR